MSHRVAISACLSQTQGSAGRVLSIPDEERMNTTSGSRYNRRAHEGEGLLSMSNHCVIQVIVLVYLEVRKREE